MSVKVNILENGKGVEMLLKGEVQGRDILLALDEVYNERNIESQEYQIIDKSKCTEYNVTCEEIEAIANVDKLASKTNSKIIMAIIESETLLFSLTELWQIQVEDFIFKSKAFIHRDHALEWIKENV